MARTVAITARGSNLENYRLISTNDEFLLVKSKFDEALPIRMSHAKVTPLFPASTNEQAPLENRLSLPFHVYVMVKTQSRCVKLLETLLRNAKSC